MSAAKNMVESLRQVALDLLVPKLKAVKGSVDSLRNEMKVSIDSLRNEIQLREELHAQALRSLTEKLDFAIDIRERLASLEARMPRQ